jgi:hypothetical protein
MAGFDASAGIEVVFLEGNLAIIVLKLNHTIVPAG